MKSSPNPLLLHEEVNRLQQSLDAVGLEVASYEYKVKNLKSFHSHGQITAWNKRLKKLYTQRKNLTKQIKDGRKSIEAYNQSSNREPGGSNNL